MVNVALSVLRHLKPDSLARLTCVRVLQVLLERKRPVVVRWWENQFIYEYTVGLSLIDVPELEIAYPQSFPYTNPLEAIVENAFARPGVAAMRIRAQSYRLTIGTHMALFEPGVRRPSHKVLSAFVPVDVMRLSIDRGVARAARACTRQERQ